MTDQEMDRLLTELAKSRTLNIFERAAFSDSLIDMSMGDAGALLARAFSEHAHVNPAVINKLRGRDDGNGNALAAWDFVCDRILEGPNAELYWRQHEAVPSECFDDPAAYEAFRKTAKFIRREPADVARRKFLNAYKAASTPKQALGEGTATVRAIR